MPVREALTCSELPLVEVAGKGVAAKKADLGLAPRKAHQSVQLPENRAQNVTGGSD